jgi:hypothetical protein
MQSKLYNLLRNMDWRETEMAAVDQNLSLGERVQLRKKHPCGSDIWTVVRLGADVGLVCEGCGRKVFLERHILRKRARQVLPPTDTQTLL